MTNNPTLEIPLTRGKVARVSQADFQAVSLFSWYAFKNGATWYAARRTKLPSGKQPITFMHRFILDPPSNLLVDHKDGDGLNNTRENLRAATRIENLWNAKTREDNQSGIRGVCWHQASGKWMARIEVHKKVLYLGLFGSIEEATEVRRGAEKKHYGEFAPTRNRQHK